MATVGCFFGSPTIIIQSVQNGEHKLFPSVQQVAVSPCIALRFVETRTAHFRILRNLLERHPFGRAFRLLLEPQCNSTTEYGKVGRRVKHVFPLSQFLSPAGPQNPHFSPKITTSCACFSRIERPAGRAGPGGLMTADEFYFAGDVPAEWPNRNSQSPLRE